MKNTVSRLSALILALVMLLTMLVGCNNPSDTTDTNITDNTDTPAVTESIQITTTI